MTLRIAAGIFLFISLFWLPFWITALYGIVCLYAFDSFYELIPAAALADLLYGAHEHRFAGFVFITTLVAIVLVVGMRSLKALLRK